MVAPVPPQISKLRPVYPPHRPSAPCQLSLPTTCCRLSFGHSFVFMLLQIPLPASPLFSHPSKSPGGVGVQASNLPPNSCLCGKSIVFRYLPPLFPLFASFLQSLPLFSIVCGLFPKHPGGGVPRPSYRQTVRCPKRPSAIRNVDSARTSNYYCCKLKVPGPWMKPPN